MDSLFLATPREGYYPNQLCRSTERLSSRPSPSADEGAGIQTPGRLTPGSVRSPSILLLGGDMCPTASPSAHGLRPVRAPPVPTLAAQATCFQQAAKLRSWPILALPPGRASRVVWGLRGAGGAGRALFSGLALIVWPKGTGMLSGDGPASLQGGCAGRNLLSVRPRPENKHGECPPCSVSKISV